MGMYSVIQILMKNAHFHTLIDLPGVVLLRFALISGCFIAFLAVGMASENGKPARTYDHFDTDLAEKLIAAAWERYPANRTFESRVRTAEEQVHQTRWSYLNSVNLSYLYTPDFMSTASTGTSDQRFGLGLAINVGGLLSVPSRIVQAEEGLKIENAMLATQRLFIRKDVLQRYARFVEQYRVCTLRTQTAREFQDMLMLTKKKFEEGEVQLDRYTLALTSYSDALVAQVGAESALESNRAALEELLGTTIEEVQ